MKDIILEGFIADFCEKYGFTSLPQSEQFERFASFSILSRAHSCPDDLDSLILGGTQDGGIDSVAISVNGIVVHSPKDIDYFIERFRKLDVEIVFIQAKTSPKFDGGELGKFLFGVEQILTSLTIPLSPEVAQVRETILYTLKKSVYMDRLPKLSCYYATTGSWNDPPELVGLIDGYHDRYKKVNLFESVTIKPVDAVRLREYYRAVTRANDQVFEFSRVVVLPKIDNVEEAYIGAVQAKELLKLIAVDDRINKGVFYDNVRDFQGSNAVNQEIADTIANSSLEGKFVLMNNGVTIVAKSLRRTGESFRIIDFQVVNGCQTSHIVFECREKLTNTIWLPLKLVITSNQDVTNDVIRATNRQTPVLPEALETLSKFHRDLEDFYKGYPAKFAGPELYYERRSKQFDGTSVMQNQIVSITTQIKAFISVFLDEPHSQHRYYGELLDAYRDRMFLDDHLPDAYFCSCVVLFAVDKVLGQGPFHGFGRKYKYHVAMAIKYLILQQQVPKHSTRAIATYCRSICEVVEDPQRRDDLISRALRVIVKLEPQFPVVHGNGPLRRRDFTLALLSEIRGQVVNDENAQDYSEISMAVNSSPRATLREGQKLGGIIKWANESRGFGMLQISEDEEDLFVALNEMHAVPWLSWKAGTKVEFIVGRNHRGWCAKRVKLAGH